MEEGLTQLKTLGLPLDSHTKMQKTKFSGNRVMHGSNLLPETGLQWEVSNTMSGLCQLLFCLQPFPSLHRQSHQDTLSVPLLTSSRQARLQ